MSHATTFSASFLDFVGHRLTYNRRFLLEETGKARRSRESTYWVNLNPAKYRGP